MGIMRLPAAPASPYPSRARMRSLSFSVGVGVLFLWALLPSTAHAQPKTSPQAAAQADQLFQEGRQLMLQEGKVKEGCAKLAQSQALDPASGTLLNLGECYEKLKQFSTAFTTYKQAREPAREGKRQDWLSFAEEKMRAIEPKIPRLRLVGRKPAGAHVELDGRLLEGAEPGVAVRVDPGDHRIVVVVGERELSSQTVQATEGATLDVVLDPASPKVSPSSPPPASSRPSTPEPAPQPSRPIAPAVWALGIGSVVSFAAGGVLLGVREGQVSSMVTDCGRDGTSLPPEKFTACSDRGSSADRSMTFSIIGFGLGAALAGTALVLHFGSSDAHGGSGAAGTSASCAPGIGGASCLVRF